MGVAAQTFDPWERPKLSDYQLKVGLTQFSRSQEMMQKRRIHSALIDDALKDLSKNI